MTIQYSDQFFKLLLRWKGSLWKTIYKDLIVFLILYYTINSVYRFVLNAKRKQEFENVISLLNDYISQIPLTFLLGFYVGMVVQRWWNQFSLLAWPDNLLFYVSAYIRGKNTEAKVLRRTIARYAMVSMILAWRSISIRVLKRFPTVEHLVNCGLLTEEEYELFNQVDIQIDPHKGWFVPLNWIQSLVVKCYEQKRLTHTNELKFLLDELHKYRRKFSNLFQHQWVNIPLVYTQVATIAVYGYFGLCLIGRQYPHRPTNAKETVDMYVPVVTILQFLFYVGWLKVGEDLINPMGSDDEDFELNYLLDRHYEMSYLIIDELHQQLPHLYTDTMDDEPVVLPHTVASSKITDNPACRYLDAYKFKTESATDYVEIEEEQKRYGHYRRASEIPLKESLCCSFCMSENKQTKKVLKKSTDFRRRGDSCPLVVEDNCVQNVRRK